MTKNAETLTMDRFTTRFITSQQLAEFLGISMTTMRRYHFATAETPPPRTAAQSRATAKKVVKKGAK